MRFLADMGISMRIVEWLRSNGHDVVHLREQNLYSLPDSEIFDKAINESRIILTFDLDFGEIVALSKSRKVSVILFRLRNTTTPFVIKRLDTMMTESAALLAETHIVIIEENRYRTRKLPDVYKK
jgi:predicted nuclease of predicted toxin-antitoxin system